MSRFIAKLGKKNTLSRFVEVPAAQALKRNSEFETTDSADWKRRANGFRQLSFVPDAFLRRIMPSYLISVSYEICTTIG